MNSSTNIHLIMSYIPIVFHMLHKVMYLKNIIIWNYHIFERNMYFIKPSRNYFMDAYDRGRQLNKSIDNVDGCVPTIVHAIFVKTNDLTPIVKKCNLTAHYERRDVCVGVYKDDEDESGVRVSLLFVIFFATATFPVCALNYVLWLNSFGCNHAWGNLISTGREYGLPTVRKTIISAGVSPEQLNQPSSSQSTSDICQTWSLQTTNG